MKRKFKKMKEKFYNYINFKDLYKNLLKLPFQKL